ncbi:MAG: Lar family restriction alleviation protein [Bacilli bacterium]|nr:Lar family restriction alleviation protein [Bacilli bacterium]
MKQKEINKRLDRITHYYNVLNFDIESLNKEVKKMQKKLSRCVEKEEEILPCPFCGCSGGLFCKLIDQEEFFYVKCTNGHCLSDMKETKEEAINEWNKRI